MLTQGWEHLLEGETADALMRALPNVLQARRWFGGKARQINAVGIVDSIVIPSAVTTTMLLLIRVEYEEGTAETYTLPVTAEFGEESEHIQRDFPQAVLAPLTVQINGREQTGLIYEAMWNRDFALSLLDAMGQRTQFKGHAGSLIASSTKVFADLVPAKTLPEPAVMKAEQSNTSVTYGERVILKLYRRLEQGMNPDLEIGRALTHMRFPYIPAIAGALEYQRNSGEPITLALLHQFVRNDGDAWRHTLEAIDRFIARVGEGDLMNEGPPLSTPPLLDLARKDYPLLARQLIGSYLESAEQLGRRTAELHVALSQIPDNAAFGPEPLTIEYRKGRYDSMVRNMTGTLALLRERMERLSTAGQANARCLFDLKSAMERTFDAFKEIETSVPRIRCHGDYHLGQVLWTGTDFMIIDFEGEPARSLAERRMKHPALVDVAGMVRSFHYAPFAFLELKRAGSVMASQEASHARAPWAKFWSDWTSAAFLKAYLGIATGARFWPQNKRDVRLLFDVYLIDKAIYELGYELNNRPEWVNIPLHGLVELLKKTG